MIPFLQQVANHYFDSPDLENTCFVFPNRRAEVFFRKYLSEAVWLRNEGLRKQGRASEARPVLTPAVFRMNEFFYEMAQMSATDNVRLLVELYSCYKELNPKAEPLDDFIFWGDVILSDFDDTDKYLAEPAALFANVGDFKTMQDDFSYLNENQRNAIRQFLYHFPGFSDKGSKNGGSDVKKDFLMIWNILYRLYKSFGERLSGQGLAYEGMVYRKVAEMLGACGKKDGAVSVADLLAEHFPNVHKIVFVGLNALNECEKYLLARLRDAGLAEFCWDYPKRGVSGSSRYMINHELNRASFFMDRNMEDFPPVWTPEFGEVGKDGLPVMPEVNVLSVPSSIGQVKQVPEILERIAGGHERLSCVALKDIRTRTADDDGKDTVIVLPDENLLSPLVNTIPEEIDNINVTMGCPMTSSSFYSLMSDILSLQLHLRRRGAGYSFYYKPVRAVFANPVFRCAVRDGMDIASGIEELKMYYIPEDRIKALVDVDGIENEEDKIRIRNIFDTIFTPVVTDVTRADKQVNLNLQSYLKTVISLLGQAMSKETSMKTEVEFAKKYYTCINSLDIGNIDVRPDTYVRLLNSVLSIQTVPYRGEPLKGLQIMGPLETRALDFSNVVILSCNEGMFPRHSVSSSFIPPELRKGFGLPTYEYQDSVWAYYFYRLLLRAGTVWLVYDSRPDKVPAGEESRYIKQLQYHFHCPINRYVAVSEVSAVKEENAIPKPEDIAERLAQVRFSASSINTYLACPAKFYYEKIESLSADDDDVSEVLDKAMSGTVFHEMMQIIYGGPGVAESFLHHERGDVFEVADEICLPDVPYRISAGYLKQWMEPAMLAKMKSLVDILICNKLRTDEVTGRNLVYADMIMKYLRATLDKDIRLLAEKGTAAFTIYGLEKRLSFDMDVDGVMYRFVGYIDREDSCEEGVMRIIDYKTGTVKPEDVGITDENAEDIVAKIFDEDSDSRPAIALQLFIYDIAQMDEARRRSCTIENSIYAVSRLYTEDIFSSRLSDRFVAMTREKLKDVIRNMADRSGDNACFRRTENAAVCEWCDFKVLCGR